MPIFHEDHLCMCLALAGRKDVSYQLSEGTGDIMAGLGGKPGSEPKQAHKGCRKEALRELPSACQVLVSCKCANSVGVDPLATHPLADLLVSGCRWP